MKSKDLDVNNSNLFVAIEIWDNMIELEKWVSNESSGRLKHNLVVSNKIILVYSKIDENGNINYYNYRTNQKLTVVKKMTNFESKSLNNINNKIDSNISERLGLIAFVIPYEQFEEDNLIIRNKKISGKLAQRMVNLYNFLYGNIPFDLCDNEEDSWNEIYNNLCFSINYDKIVKVKK